MDLYIAGDSRPRWSRSTSRTPNGSSLRSPFLRRVLRRVLRRRPVRAATRSLNGSSDRRLGQFGRPSLLWSTSSPSCVLFPSLPVLPWTKLIPSLDPRLLCPLCRLRLPEEDFRCAFISRKGHVLHDLLRRRRRGSPLRPQGIQGHLPSVWSRRSRSSNVRFARSRSK